MKLHWHDYVNWLKDHLVREAVAAVAALPLHLWRHASRHVVITSVVNTTHAIRKRPEQSPSIQMIDHFNDVFVECTTKVQRLVAKTLQDEAYGRVVLQTNRC